MKDLNFTGERVVGKTVEEVRRCSPPTGMEHVERYEWACSRVMPDTVLDCCCGVGYGTWMLSNVAGVKNVIGVDIDADTIEYASTYYSRDNIRYEVQDMTKLNLSNSFSTIVSLESIEHIPDPSIVLKRFKELLQPLGVLIVSLPIIKSTHINRFHAFDIVGIDAAKKYFMDNGFEILEHYVQKKIYGIFYMRKA